MPLATSPSVADSATQVTVLSCPFSIANGVTEPACACLRQNLNHDGVVSQLCIEPSYLKPIAILPLRNACPDLLFTG